MFFSSFVDSQRLKNTSLNFRFISRQDLISWKAKLEYGVMPGINEEVG